MSLNNYILARILSKHFKFLIVSPAFNAWPLCLFAELSIYTIRTSYGGLRDVINTLLPLRFSLMRGII